MGESADSDTSIADAARRRRTSQSLGLALFLASAAGAVEAYSVIVLGAFAGAQTGNVVLGAIAASRSHWHDAARYGIPILAFAVGVLIASTLSTPKMTKLVHRPYRALLALELLVFVVVGFLPSASPRLLASILITVAVAAQAATFRTLVDVGYNSAFTTGNLMNTIGTAHTALVRHDHEALVHTRRGAIVIVTYALGAVVGSLCAHAFGQHGVWCAAVILVGALLFFVTDERKQRQSVPE